MAALGCVCWSWWLACCKTNGSDGASRAIMAARVADRHLPTRSTRGAARMRARFSKSFRVKKCLLSGNYSKKIYFALGRKRDRNSIMAADQHLSTRSTRGATRTRFSKSLPCPKYDYLGKITKGKAHFSKKMNLRSAKKLRNFSKKYGFSVERER